MWLLWTSSEYGTVDFLYVYDNEELARKELAEMQEERSRQFKYNLTYVDKGDTNE